VSAEAEPGLLCSWGGAPHAYPCTVGVLQNPVTRFGVRVEPPVEIRSALEWDAMEAKFSAYCQAAWSAGPDVGPIGPLRLSPDVIPASWLTYSPPSA
jgi:hypothetical protein